MKKNLKTLLRILAWSVLALAGAFAALQGYLCWRYSPEYVRRELFEDLGNVYDHLYFPGRELSASPDPFRFTEEASGTASVLAAFSAGPGIDDPAAFLEGTRTQAFLVIQDDSLLYEAYFLGQQRDSIVTSFSVAKSFTSALIGIAIQEGAIASVDEPITTYLPELLERDPAFGRISIRHLLQMASGLRYDTGRWSSFGDDNLTYMFDDMRHLALTETEVVEEPGINFLYNNYNPLLLGMVLERATGMSVSAYLQEKIWTPLEMEYAASWSLDSDESGFEKMESGLNARAIDFAKFGRLYMNGGNWDGQQIVPAEWVAESTRDQGLLRDGPFTYGLMWWGKSCSPGSQDLMAMGNFGQFIYISVEKNVIIVRNGEDYGLPGEGDAWATLFCELSQALP